MEPACSRLYSVDLRRDQPVGVRRFFRPLGGSVSARPQFCSGIIKYSLFILIDVSYFGFRCATPALIVSFSSGYVSSHAFCAKANVWQCARIHFSGSSASAFTNVRSLFWRTGYRSTTGHPFRRAGIVHSNDNTNRNQPHRADLVLRIRQGGL